MLPTLSSFSWTDSLERGREGGRKERGGGREWGRERRREGGRKGEGREGRERRRRDEVREGDTRPSP